MDKKFCPYCMNPVKEGESCKICGLTEGIYTPRDHHLPLGTVLHNRYLIGRVLGEGGFGITYIGCDLNLEMKVAIKEYFPIDRVYRISKASLKVSNYAHAAEKFHSGKVKFLGEARTMARLDKQQNIVSVRDFFEENETAYIVMEYVEGTTLKELVGQRGGRIPAGELLHMLEPLFPALASVHELGLIHRDISPDNLMLENGKIKLLDFGCAREAASESETKTIALKQGYAPIEQYQHKGQGPWTDVYALSATIYFCLTGRVPQSAVDRLSEEELIPPRKLGVDLTAGQEAALLQGMNVRVKDRFQSAEELYVALYTNVMPGPIVPEPISIPESDPNKDPQNNIPPGTDISNKTIAIVNPSEELNLPDMDHGEENPAEKNTAEENTAEENSAAADSTEDEIHKKLAILKRFWTQNMVKILAGSVILLVAVVCIVWVVIPKDEDDKKEVIASGTEGSGGDIGSGDGHLSGGQLQPGPSGNPSEEFPTVEELFADAVVLEDFSKKGIQALMEDDTVPAIRISEVTNGGALNGTITITKPVLVEKNISIGLFDMMVVKGEKACLWIEGELGGDFILQTADGGKVVVDHQYIFYPRVLWLEKEEDVRLLDGGELVCDDVIIAGENTLFQNAVFVRDEASLRQAMDEGEAVIICENITIKTALYAQTSIRIEEGVTVTMQGAGSLTGGEADFCLWNEGKIQGGLIQTKTDQTDVDRKIINYGEISVDSLRICGNLVNLGDLAIDHIDAEQGQSSICNIGTLRFQSESTTLNADLTNYGSVLLCSNQNSDSINITAEIDNYGEIRIEEGLIILQSYLLNKSNGRVVICDNATLENRGVIEVFSGDLACESKGVLENGEGAVYYHYFSTEYPPESGWVHFTNADAAPDPDRVCTVRSMEELLDAMQNPEVEKIYLTGDVRCSDVAAVTLTKDVEIQPDAGLYMIGDSSNLIVDGCFLQNYGHLQVDTITLTHGGSLRNDYTMALSGSGIKLGNVYGEMNYDWTDCLMNYGSISSWSKNWPYHGIELFDHALMIQKGSLQIPWIQIKEQAYFANMGEIQWGEEGMESSGSLEILEGGQFHNLAWQSWMENLEINIGEDSAFRNFGWLNIHSGSLYVAPGGFLESSLNDITFGYDLSVQNDGKISLCMGGDSSFLRGYLENHGNLQILGPSGFVIDAPSGAANPARLDNQGEVRIWDSQNGYIRCDNGEFIGNSVVYGSK